MIEISETFVFHLILFVKGAENCIVEYHVRHRSPEGQVISVLDLSTKHSHS